MELVRICGNMFIWTFFLVFELEILTKVSKIFLKHPVYEFMLELKKFSIVFYAHFAYFKQSWR
jgi:hypothetical protein